MADAYYRYPRNSPRAPNAAQRRLKPLPPAPQYFTEGSSGQYPRAFCSRNTRGFFPAANQTQTAEHVHPLPSHKVGLGNYPAVVNENASETQDANRWSDEYDIDGDMLRPKRLKKPTFNSVLFTIGDVFMALMPLYFIVLGILSVKLHDKPVDGNTTGRNVTKALKLGPTIFPIVFAAVAGRGMKTIARYYAERGAKLGMLELLVASQTVWGAFETQVLLRQISLVGLHLLLLWSMSPLGSQASFRVLGTGQSVEKHANNALFMPTGGMSANQFQRVAFYDSDSDPLVTAANSLYTSLLMSNKNETQDIWGNVKVPWYSALDAKRSAVDEWISVPSSLTSDSFTSLAGVPVAGGVYHNRSNSETLFDVEFAHFSLECNGKAKGPLESHWWKDQLGIVWGKDGIMTGKDPFEPRIDATRSSFFLDSNTPETESRFNYILKDKDPSSSTTFSRRNVLFGSLHYERSAQQTETLVMLRNCSVEMPYVEARIRCIAEGCGVEKMRPSLKYKDRDPAITTLDLVNILGNFFMDLPGATGKVGVGGISSSELFILGSSTPLVSLLGTTYQDTHWKYAVDSRAHRSMYDVPNDVFAKRLAILLNTYYMLSNVPWAYIGNLPAPPNTGDWGPHGDPVTACSNGPFCGQETTATTMDYVEVYKCDYVWLALLLTASAALLILGSVGTILKGYCRAPDVLGFVSSSTYDNKYMDLPPTGALDGMERSRLLKHVTVKIGDVWQGKSVGHVAFSSGKALAASLRFDRLYV